MQRPSGNATEGLSTGNIAPTVTEDQAFLRSLKRTHRCAEVTTAAAAQTVVLMGWVNNRRDHGGLIFVDLRDRSGLIQVVLNPQLPSLSTAKDFRSEYVVAIQGLVRMRPAGMANSQISTGLLEVEALRCEILSEAKTPPFAIDDAKVSESLRLKYRYLELRSQRLQNHLILRHRVSQLVRSVLSDEGFIEVETPILYKSTPEGARDYLVPSRVNQGLFYALPQSPQTLKQLLMIGGMDRYFQICRCFRDEDLRADRQPEFSQIDIEMSFVETEDVLEINEILLRRIWQDIRGVSLGTIPRMSYQEAMDRYGTDKPDLRNPLEIRDVSAIAGGKGFQVFDEALGRQGVVRALAVAGMGAISRSQIDKWTLLVKQLGSKGLVWMKSTGGQLTSPIAKFFSAEDLLALFHACGGEEGGAVFLVADEYHTVCQTLGSLRVELAKELNLVDTSSDKFLWVVDFPLLEYDTTAHRWAACHHPFTMVQDRHLPVLLEGRDKEFSQMRAKAYDLVCNGYEIAGGSIRIHRQEIQSAMFKALGLSEAEIQMKFGFFVEALKYGTPPHGGVAWGLDRLVMILANTEAIRDVIAFPKTAKATDLMAEAPSEVDQAQLLELGLRLGVGQKPLV